MQDCAGCVFNRFTEKTVYWKSLKLTWIKGKDDINNLILINNDKIVVEWMNAKCDDTCKP